MATATALSRKRESWIAIGNSRIRVPNDFHHMLSRFCSERYYTKQFDALLYLAALGLKVVHQAEGRNEIKVADGDENADPTTARSEAAAR